MGERLKRVISEFGDLVSSLSADRLSGSDALVLHDLFVRAERFAMAGRTLTAGAIDRSGAFRAAGHRTAAHFVAASSGISVGAAVATIETARALPTLPATVNALTSGTLSAPQAAAVARGASADPSAESQLLQAAGHEDVASLRRRAAMICASAPGGEDRLEHIRASRHLRHTDDVDGAIRLDGRFAPDDGAKLRAVLDARASELRQDAKRVGIKLSNDHARADALVSLITTGGATARAVVHVHVDAAAYERGRLEPGERCEVAGSGPITVAPARAFASGGTVKLIDRDGHDVRRVAHHRRSIPSHVRSAVDARYPKCAIASCPNHRDLEYDHRTPLAEGGETSIRNLWRLCAVRCHFLKTHRAWKPIQRNGVWDLIPPGRGP